ncbi:D-beta-D-heptose 7-phosphate kinase/D-beta-D-heptose 1-phosphate adenosyltransferase [Deinobacterium chartae]|uniref:Bifunctional protein HldE n=1 Tax=Deinobacterium chartae TaxID=521158 RepID=A0A841HXL7_9DEIO|nr:D-glycero-beta-D-manno-heptose 1-phosphate adenylyltransferase [Deinobacterium chartae]MBB6097394.1 D-beta-D-heptose 7-phosphate kinase/D-beta-D-heptose 1-phosphate adenosyltransferase [Deinobacterium chartae]
MNRTLHELVDAFRHLRVLVIGEAMLDSYLSGEVGRLCREAPVPIVDVQGRHDVPGGAANTAMNVHALGARVDFLSVVGTDLEADLLRQALEAGGVDSRGLIAASGRRTLLKQRVTAGGQILLRLDQGSTEALEVRAERELIEALEIAFIHADVVIVSDYGYGVLTDRVIATLRELQARHPRVLVADARRLERYREVGVTAVKPNYPEACALLGQEACVDDEARLEQMRRQGPEVLRRTGARMAAVTLDVAGGWVFERGQPPYRTYTHPAPNSAATGAGDTFVSALALALGVGAHAHQAADLASAAARVVVGRAGTTACRADELRGHIGAERKLQDVPTLCARLAYLRSQGRRVVFTNGCFDLLHRGHITYLNQAKALGDVLVVGLNSDDSIRRLKGPQRPINTLEDRAEVLAGLSCVDHIVAFDEDTPARLIEQIRPEVYVKGGDYTLQTLPEAPLVLRLGGEVRLLPYLEDRSTSGIIERVRQAYGGSGYAAR